MWSVVFSPCGNCLASASDDETVRIWSRLSEEQAIQHGLKVDGKMPGRPGEKWICTNILKGWWTRTIYKVDWTQGKDGTLGRIAACAGDGRICVFDVMPPTSKTSMAPVVVIVASVSEAHGVSDVNSLSFGPVDLSGRSSGFRMQDFPDAGGEDEDVGEGEDEMRFVELNEVGQSRSHKQLSWNHLIASTGDDGSVKVWKLPPSIM